ncbi:hypothetical protein KC352_g8 [Hortaea werneckii]|nr:hypothetical protein KC352_g8 [Hortaea werneckii]
MRPLAYIQQLKKAPKIDKSLAHPNFIVRGCDWCRPARRCPECSTEYLVEIQMIEDAKDPARPFKHSIVVTRWSDLGDGSSPHTSAEWASMNGVDVADHAGGHEYESFSHVGRRAERKGTAGIKRNCTALTTSGAFCEYTHRVYVGLYAQEAVAWRAILFMRRAGKIVNNEGLNCLGCHRSAPSAARALRITKRGLLRLKARTICREARASEQPVTG